MSTWFVTGGLGVIGSKFVEIIINKGDKSIILDAAEEPRNIWIADKLKSKFKDRVEIITSRLEKEPLDEIIKKSDAILHAAAHTGIPHSTDFPSDDWISNVDATRLLLESIRKTKPNTPTIMLSSVKPYKTDHIKCKPGKSRMIWNDNFNGIDESVILEPDEPYAASKMAQSALGMAYGRTYNIPVTVLRCSNLYGDAPCHGPRHGWLTWFCISAALDWHIELQGSGVQTRDMLFSNDVASAVLASYENIGNMKGNVYNIGGGAENTISCIEAIHLLQDITKKEMKIKTKPSRKNEDLLFLTNFNKFNSITNWKPTIGVRKGIEFIYNWAISNKEDLGKIYAEVKPS